MSTIYFHSPSGDAALRGAERHWYGSLVNKTFLAHVDVPDVTDKYEDCWINHLIPKSSYAGQILRDAWDPTHPHGFMKRGYSHQVQTTIRTYLTTTGMMGEYFIWGDKQIDPFHLALNTAIAAGSSAVRLAARIHGQCEIHLWIAGKNRKWLADVMRRGLRDRVLREGMGYLKPASFSMCDLGVIELLEKTEDEPVVTSYSGCDSFPNLFHVPDPTVIPGYSDPSDAANSEKEEWEIQDDNIENFCNLPVAQQWELTFPHLDPGLELKPDDFEDYGFGSGTSIFDIRHDFLLQQEAKKKALQS